MSQFQFEPPPPATNPGDLAGRQWQAWFAKMYNYSATVSVALQMPVNTFTVSGSPVLNSGTLGVTYNSQAPNLSLMSPVSGSGTPTWRASVIEDIPFASTNVLTWLNM